MTWTRFIGHIAAASIALPVLAGAPTAPSGISVDRQPARAGEPVRVTINFEAASNLCGLQVDFGDGDVRQIVAERFPLSFVKHYVAPGRYVIRAEGRGVLRGLQSAFGCAGAPRSLVLPVVAASAAPPSPGIPAREITSPAPVPSAPSASSPRTAPPPVVDRVPTPVPAPAAPPSPSPSPGRSRDESLRVF